MIKFLRRYASIVISIICVCKDCINCVKFAGMSKIATLLLYAIVLSVLAVVIYSQLRPIPPLNDSVEYQLAANNLLNKNTLYSGNLKIDLDYRLFSKRTLGFPLFIIFQGVNPSVILLSTTLLYIVMFFLGLQILRNFTQTRLAYTSYSFFFLLHTTLTIHLSWVMADVLVSVVTTAIVATYYSSSTDNPTKLRVICTLWAIGLLLKPVFLPSLILVPIIFTYLKQKNKTWCLSLLLPISAWLLGCGVNWNNTGTWEYSSISTINLGQYNTKLMIAGTDGVAAADSFTSTTAFAIPTNKDQYVQYKKEVRAESVSAIRNNLPAYIKIHVAGMIKMLIDPGRFEIYTFLGLNDNEVSLTELLYSGDWVKVKRVMSQNALVLIFFLLLLIISLIKLILATFSLYKYRRFVFLIFVIVYFVGITGPVGAARFMLPVSIVYIVLVAIGVESLLAFFQKRSER